METVFVILLAVVSLVQIALFTLFFLEKRHNHQRNNAMLTYIDHVVEDGISNCQDEVNKRLNAFGKNIDERFKSRDEKANQQWVEFLQEIQNILTEQENKANERLNSMLLDYTQAQEAANKINDFSASLASIFDYDPIRAIQKGRKKEAS